MRPRPGPIAGTIVDAAAAMLLPTLAVLAVACLPASARGQHCGSYVIRPGDDALARALGLGVRLDEPTVPAPGQPCRGPSCSEAPETPVPPAATIEPPSVEHWAYVAPDRPADGPGHAPLPSSDLPPLAGPPIGGIFHPPRPAS